MSTQGIYWVKGKVLLKAIGQLPKMRANKHEVADDLWP
jgi:hypothetical protein